MSKDYSSFTSNLIAHLESLDRSNSTANVANEEEDQPNSLADLCGFGDGPDSVHEHGATAGGESDDLNRCSDEPDECGQQSPPRLYGVDQEPAEDELIDHEYETDYSVYENKTGLAEDMKFLASMPELCDVTFLVGETREPVCAVRSVLAARSR